MYDENAKLFYVGYDCDSEELCKSHYDLLMSEARQMSFIEVAENSVSSNHWTKLSRDRNTSKKPVMMSWGGSTFEYFMPYIFMDVSHIHWNIIRWIIMSWRRYDTVIIIIFLLGYQRVVTMSLIHS